jgi:hypothetical protein
VMIQLMSATSCNMKFSDFHSVVYQSRASNSHSYQLRLGSLQTFYRNKMLPIEVVPYNIKPEQANQPQLLLMGT